MKVDIHLMNENLSKKSFIQIPFNLCELSLKPWSKWKFLSMNHEMNIMSKLSFCNRIRLKEAVYHPKSALQSKVYGVIEVYKNVSGEVGNFSLTIPLNSIYPVLMF